MQDACELLNGSLFRASFSPRRGAGGLNQAQKEKQEKKGLPSFASASLSSSPSLGVCVCVTQQNPPLQPTFFSPFLSPLHKFFPSLPFISLQPTVGRLNRGPSSCQGSATGNAFKPNDSRAETEQPLCYAKAPLWPASEK